MADTHKNDEASRIAEDKKAEIWFEKNWKKLLTVIVLTLVVAMAVFAFIYHRNAKSANAMKALAEAEVAELPALLKKYADVPGAAVARMRLADDLLAKKDFTAAVEQYKLIIADKNVMSENRNRARLNIAACDEFAGRKKEAADKYLQIMNDLSVSQLCRDEAGYQAGRILADLRDSKAKEILQKVVVSVPGTAVQVNPWKNSAAALLKNLQ